MKRTVKRLSKLPWLPICFILLVVIFFSIRLVVTYDSAHYLNYVAIFENNAPTSSWDIVRGPIFPVIIFSFNILFGKTGTGFLVGMFLFYLLFVLFCYKICQKIFFHYKHKTIIQNTILAILCLNPLIFGYFHTMLTEFIAITITTINIFIAFKWLNCDVHRKSHLILYSLYFALNLIICYHLKQPYIIIAFIPLLVASIISIANHHTIKNIIYRISTILISILLLFISIFIWNVVLENMGANTTTGRDSSSLLSHQILQAFQINHDFNNDGENDQISTPESIGILSNNFFSNPLEIMRIYIGNYCGLSSICTINSNDGVNYSSTLNPAGLETFENSIIAYRPYENAPNIFPMPEKLYSLASEYGESSNRSIFAIIFGKLGKPTNLLFKFSIFMCFPALIVLFIFRIKYKNKKHSSLFHLSTLLLLTSFAHLAISSGLGLIIDRYAIEIFVPSALGILGTASYCRLVFVKKPKKHIIAPTKGNKNA